MSEPKFQSALTMERIEENFKDIDVFSGIMDGLQEALAYSKEEAATETILELRKQQ